VNRTAADPRHRTRVRRERRADAEIEVPVGERVERECPECGECFEVLVAGSDDGPSFDSCSNWDCDAFLAFQHQQREINRDSGPAQTALGQFAGGE